MPRLSWTTKPLLDGSVQHVGSLGQVACAYVTPVGLSASQVYDVETTLPGVRYPRTSLKGVVLAKADAEQRVTVFLSQTGLLDQLDGLRDELKSLRAETLA